MSKYVEFAVTSNFSFLWGASHPEELIAQAARLEYSGFGLCDRNNVAGVVRAHLAKREMDLELRYHPGARLVFCDGTPDILAYPRDRAGWAKLCRLLTRGNLRAEKGGCILNLEDLIEHTEGLELVVMERATRKAAFGEYGKGAPQSPPSPRRGEGGGEGDRAVRNLKDRPPLTRQASAADLSPVARRFPGRTSRQVQRGD